MSDLSDQVDELENTVQDLSDNTDQSFSDTSDSLEQISQNLDDLNQNEGQLMFPLTQDTIDLITEQAPAIISAYQSNGYIGQATLVAGTATINTNLLSPTSLIFLSRMTLGGGIGNLSYTISATSFTINSDDPTETSLINYLITP